jgi:plastocyanin
MRRILLGLLGVVVLVGGACGSSSKSGASGQTRTVNVDGKSSQFLSAFLAYFPNQLTVHPGDSVEFKEIWTGEPHTVTMGTLVEAGLSAAKAAGPDKDPGPAYDSLPSLLPQGPGDVNQNAGQPCFLDTGAPPSNAATACAKTAQPAFNGKQSYYNSGFLAKDSTYTVKLASDIAPGAYHFYCNLHGPIMSGTITVVASTATVPSQSDVDAQGKSQLDALSNQLLPAYQAAQAGHPQLPGGISGNLAGLLSESVSNAEVEQFLPANVQAKIGQKVSWTILGPHTITFGAPATIPPIITIAPDGSVHGNQQAGAPSPAPSSPPLAANPNGPPQPQTIDGGTYDGTGFHNSGVQASFPPGLITYTLTFTKSGTFAYACMIHPGMTGIVTVS